MRGAAICKKMLGTALDKNIFRAALHKNVLGSAFNEKLCLERRHERRNGCIAFRWCINATVVVLKNC